MVAYLLREATLIFATVKASWGPMVVAKMVSSAENLSEYRDTRCQFATCSPARGEGINQVARDRVGASVLGEL